MIQEILIIFLLFVLPVALLYFKIIPFKLKVHTLGIISLLLLFIAFFRGWGVEILGLQLDKVGEYIIPYTIFTLIAGCALIVVSKILKRKGKERWWEDNHFLYGFMVVSIFQEFVFRGFLIPELQLIFSSVLIIIIINSLLFMLIHVIYSDDIKALALIFIGGIGFAVMYVYYPSLILIVISHAILNLIIVYYGFFSEEKVKLN